VNKLFGRSLRHGHLWGGSRLLHNVDIATDSLLGEANPSKGTSAGLDVVRKQFVLALVSLWKKNRYSKV